MDSDTGDEHEAGEDFQTVLNFKKMSDTLHLSGFREGITAGKDATFQSGFDQGYKEGLNVGLSLGILNGIISSLKNHPDFKNDLAQNLDKAAFDKSRHGLCQLCDPTVAGKSGSSEVSQSNSSENSLACILQKQKTFNLQTFEEHKRMCLPLLETTGISMDVLNYV